MEERCTAVLVAVGSQFPGMVIVKLWDRLHLHNMPPRSLLVAVGKLSSCQGMNLCGGRVSLRTEAAGHGGAIWTLD